MKLDEFHSKSFDQVPHFLMFKLAGPTKFARYRFTKYWKVSVVFAIRYIKGMEVKGLNVI